MSQYYNPKRTRNLYDPHLKEPYKISRSKIDLYLECPRCFYLDRRLGISRPPGYPFTLNAAVDALLKKEFDKYRELQAPHPFMQQNGIDAVPFKSSKIDQWRNNFTGIQYHDPITNFLIFGAIDDVWETPDNTLIVVDYKSTSKAEEVTLDADWQVSYKRQMEIYQWLFRRNSFKVEDTGYFVYCNGITDRDVFDARLDFNISLLPYKGDDSWIAGVIKDMHSCLSSDKIPECGEDCDYCKYYGTVNEVLS